MGSEERYPTFQKYPDLFLKYQVHVWRIQHPSKWRTSSFSKKMYIFKHLTHIAFQLEIVLDFLKKWQFSRLDALSRPIKKLQRDPSDFEIKKMIINNFTYEEILIMQGAQWYPFERRLFSRDNSIFVHFLASSNISGQKRSFKQSLEYWNV